MRHSVVYPFPSVGFAWTYEIALHDESRIRPCRNSRFFGCRWTAGRCHTRNAFIHCRRVLMCL